MKTYTRSTAAVPALALLAALAAATPAQAQNCSAPSDPGACPIVAPGGARFDRCFGSNPMSPSPTQVGNNVCNGLRDLKKAADELGTQSSPYVTQAQQDIQAFLKVTLQGAINQNSIKTYNGAHGYAKNIQGQIDAYVKDPKCGSAAALNQVQQFFANQAKNVVAAGQIAAETSKAVAALTPAAAETNAILQQLALIAGHAKQRGPEAERQFQALKKAAETLQSQLKQLAALDVAGAVIAGGELVGSVGPFLSNCAGCTTALAGATTALVSGGGTAVVGGAACPETVEAFGGSCWAIAGLPAGAAASAAVSAMASGPCAEALKGAGKMAEYIEKISTFVGTSVKLAQGIASSTATAVEATQALVKLAQELGRESEPNVKAIGNSLNAIADTINASADMMSRNVAPRLTALSVSMLQQTSDNVTTMVTCYNKLQALGASLTTQVVQALAELAEATALLVDGGKVVSNIATQGQSGATAAGNHAKSEWNELKSDKDALHQDLWGVPPGQVNLAATVTNLGSLAANPVKVTQIGTKLAGLITAETKIVAESLVVGKNAFLNLDANKTSAKSKFDLAGTKAQSALTKLQSSQAPTLTVIAVNAVKVNATYGAMPQTTVRVTRVTDASLATRATSPVASTPGNGSNGSNGSNRSRSASGDLIAENVSPALSKAQVALAVAAKPTSLGTVIIGNTFGTPVAGQIRYAIGPDAACTLTANRTIMVANETFGPGQTQRSVPVTSALVQALPELMAAPRLFLLVFVDLTNQVQEGNEGNNCRSVQLQ